MTDLKKIIVCPFCLKGLTRKRKKFYCPDCRRSYPIEEDIPVLVNEEILKGEDKSKEASWKRKEIKEFDKTESYKETMERPYFRYLKEKIREELNSIKEGKEDILEAGGGVSVFADLFAGKNLIISDLNLNLLKQNKEGKKVVADGEYLPFRNESFDLIYTVGLIHHLPNQQRGLKELRRTVRQGGQIFISEPTKWSSNLFYYFLRRLFLMVFGEKLLKKFTGCGTPYESFIDMKLIKKVFSHEFVVKKKKILPFRLPPFPFLEKMGWVVGFNKFWQKVPIIRSFGTIVFITISRKKHYGV